MELYLATGNTHKAGELQGLLGAQFTVRAMPDGMPEVIEDAPDFAGNARKKLAGARAVLGPEVAIFADDSGIVVDALDGAPGIYSARFAGEQATDDANNRLLLEKLEGVPDAERGAAFVCVLALSLPGREDVCFEGRVEGRIDHRLSGANGFGYDVLFIPEGHTQTFGVLASSIKAGMSHRARAAAKLADYLVSLA